MGMPPERIRSTSNIPEAELECANDIVRLPSSRRQNPQPAAPPSHNGPRAFESNTYPSPPTTFFPWLWYYVAGPQLMELPASSQVNGTTPKPIRSLRDMVNCSVTLYPLLTTWTMFSAALFAWLGILCIPLSPSSGARSGSQQISTDLSINYPDGPPISYSVYTLALLPCYVVSSILCGGYYLHFYSPDLWPVGYMDAVGGLAIPTLVITVGLNHLMYTIHPQVITSKVWVCGLIVFGGSYGMLYGAIRNVKPGAGSIPNFASTVVSQMANDPQLDTINASDPEVKQGSARTPPGSPITANSRCAPTGGSVAEKACRNSIDGNENMRSPPTKSIPLRTMLWMMVHLSVFLGLYYMGQILTYFYFEHAPYSPIIELCCIHTFTNVFQVATRFAANYIGTKMNVTHLAIGGDFFGTLLHSMFLNNIYTMDRAPSSWVIPVFGMLYGCQRFLMIALTLTDLWDQVGLKIIRGWRVANQYRSGDLRPRHSTEEGRVVELTSPDKIVDLSNCYQQSVEAPFESADPDFVAPSPTSDHTGRCAVKGFLFDESPAIENECISSNDDPEVVRTSLYHNSDIWGF
ncbi:uncharacterized protein EV422DRAFT_542121 [Fimicolochytrium jonesii]|uniref:uncharacterized protein n=1 Tax=Fimicolochytrium jonesii TaxID=1396493 RepID=UPI0022FE7D0D|nr:uncharacterized protein EV422DRAFT_542121 [Fimicolochytrium jonesii]KAI8817255.1 hypothetical protein EV422DRAFT_542121 [Fimicolochytrium jonesii]